MRSEAVSLKVTTLADSGPGSFRDLVLASAPGDEIIFGVTGKIVLSSAISIPKAISVLGPGPSKLVVSGNNVDRVFLTSGSLLLIAGMTIRDGKVVGPNGSDGGPGQNGTAGGPMWGGAIFYNSAGGTLTLSNCWIATNTVIGGKGGRGGDNPLGAAFTPGKGGDGGKAEGGAVYRAAGQIIAVRCTFSGNETIGGKGGDGGDNINFAVAKSGGTGGEGGIGEGGAVRDVSGPWFTNCTFSGNTAIGGAGGKGGNTAASVVGGTGGDGGWGYCGAISTFINMSLKSCTIVTNEGRAGGGGGSGSGSPPGAKGAAGTGWCGGVCGYTIDPCLNSIGNTIVAVNKADQHPNAIIYFDDLGYNFIGDNDYPGPCIGALTKVGTLLSPLDPKLGPLAQNGGGLPTHAPLSLSPVVDQGHSMGVTTDERNAPRPYGLGITNASDGSDIGAFELGSTPVSASVSGGGPGGTGGTDNLVLSWPSYYGDFKLQISPALGPRANWTDVRERAVETGDTFYVTNRMSEPGGFFRLVNLP